MIRKKRMGKRIAKILSGLLVFGMVAGVVPAVPGGTVQVQADEASGQSDEHKHCVCGTGALNVEGDTSHTEQIWIGINDLSEIKGKGNYYLKNDVELESVWTCNSNVNLCLNGHTITRKITDSNATPAQKAVIYIGGTFVLTDCKENGIIKHEGENTGAGICNDMNFTMYNGKISGNNGGVRNNGTFQMYGGTISKNEANYGGGVYNHGTFNMFGGTIIENNGSNGGGVYNVNIFNMSEGEITGNKSPYGGGVYNGGGTFNMSGGTITDNTSKTYGGGGVYNYKAGTFTMSGGTITGNTSETYGGGVYNDSETAFNMSCTAEISNNKAILNGGGVFASLDSKITLSDAVKITGNTVRNIANNLYLWEESKVSANGLTSGAEIGVTTYISPADNSPVTITSDTPSAEYFKSDNSNYEIGTAADGKLVLKCKQKSPTVPVPVPKTYTYDGAVHTGIELGDNYTVVSGTNSAIDADSYEVAVAPAAGKTWEDGLTTEKTFSWEITKASQNAPTGLVGVKPTTAGGSDGKITGVNENMEYCKSGDSSYIACTGAEITGLSAGTYGVRYKGDNNYNESPVFEVTVPDADMPVYFLEIINGTGNGMYVEGTVVTITADAAIDGKVFDKWVKIYGDAVIADESSATTTVTTQIAPTTIKATYKDSETTPVSYNFWIGGTQVTSDNASGTGWSYDAGTNTLTLTDYEYNGEVYAHNEFSFYRAVIWCNDNLNINLAGENTIVSKTYDGSPNGYQDGAIYVNGDLTISGAGKLNVNSKPWYDVYGIHVENSLVIENATIVANAGDDNNDAYAAAGIYAGEGIKVRSANVTAKAGEVASFGGDNYTSYGIASGGSIIFSPDAVIYAEGKTAALNKKPEGYTGTIGLVFQQDNTIPTPGTPTIIEGANGTYTQGGQDGISFRSNDAYSNFRSVLVDGIEIGTENYTTREGSIIVTLTPAYLSTLSAGTHNISIVSTGGTATTNFTVQAAPTPAPNPGTTTPTTPTTPTAPSQTAPSSPESGTVSSQVTADTNTTQNNQTTAADTSVADTANANQSVTSPKTGEDVNVTLYTILLMVSLAGLAGIFVRNRKQNIQ